MPRDKHKHKFNHRLIESRKRASLSQEKLAQLVQVTPSAVAQWEYGNKRPSRENMLKLVGILGDYGLELIHLF